MSFSKQLLLLAALVFALKAEAQYAPAAGKAGTTAISKDSSVIVAWAQSVTVQRGWQNMSNHNLGKVNYGSEAAVLGKADNNVISLGDGGTAIVQFARAITNGPGPDFAVFENAFDDYFLELAFVEVSSDGQQYFRFPAHSLTPTDSQITTFGKLNCEKIHNLAGKYRSGYGTPFDLEEMKNIPGLDVMHISHIRIVDVVGSIDSLYATYDTANNAVNDPFPTPFGSGGFDLDAVAVLHEATSINPSRGNVELRLFPNPASNILNIETGEDAVFQIFSPEGSMLKSGMLNSGQNRIDISDLASSLYVISIRGSRINLRKSFLKL